MVDIFTFFIIFSFVNKENSLFSKGFIWYSGVISYSLYLWHHVLLSFANFLDNSIYTKIYLSPNNFASFYLNINVLLLSYVLSHLTYKFIEFPFRRVKNFKKVIFLLFLSFILIEIAAYIDKKRGLFKRFHIDFENYAKNFCVVQNEKTGLNLVKKILKSDPVNDGIKATTDDLNQNNFIILIGDSHAFMLYEGLANYIKKLNYNLLLVSNSGNAPFYKDILVSSSVNKKDIEKYFKQVGDIYKILDYMIRNKKVKKVIFCCRFIAYYMSNDYGIYSKFSNKNDSNKYQIVFSDYFKDPVNYNQKEVFKKRLKDTFEYFSLRDIDFYFVLDIPNLGFEPKVYSYQFFELNKALKKIIGINVFNYIDKIYYQDYYKGQYIYNEFILNIAKGYPKVKIIDLSKAMCDKNYCYIIKDGNYLYLDDDHLNITGSYYVAPFIVKNILEK